MWHEQLLKYSYRRSVVYYLRFGVYIKIGTTRNLRTRLTQVPHDELVAIEFGGSQLEAGRHDQFSDARHLGEWFHPTADLLAHIERLRMEFEEEVAA